MDINHGTHVFCEFTRMLSRNTWISKIKIRVFVTWIHGCDKARVLSRPVIYTYVYTCVYVPAKALNVLSIRLKACKYLHAQNQTLDYPAVLNLFAQYINFAKYLYRCQRACVILCRGLCRPLSAGWFFDTAANTTWKACSPTQ